MSEKKVAGAVLTTCIKIVITLVVILLVYVGATKAYTFGYHIFVESPISSEPGKDVMVVIPEGKSSKEIGKILKDKGLVHDATLFVFQEMFSEFYGEMKPGNYELNTSMTPQEMIAIMAAEPLEDSDEDMVSGNSDSYKEETDATVESETTTEETKVAE